jgi:hypothetical protein
MTQSVTTAAGGSSGSAGRTSGRCDARMILIDVAGVALKTCRSIDSTNNAGIEMINEFVATGPSEGN